MFEDDSTTGEPAKQQEMDSNRHTEELPDDALARVSQNKEPDDTTQQVSAPVTPVKEVPMLSKHPTEVTDDPPHNVPAEADTNSNKLGESLPNYNTLLVEDKAEASPSQNSNRTISKSFTAADTTTTERPRTASERVFAELSAYLTASPVIQRTGDTQPSTTPLDTETSEGEVTLDDDALSPNTSPGKTATDADTAKHNEAQSSSPHLLDTAVKDDAPEDTSESLPDYESPPDNVDQVPELPLAPDNSQQTAPQHPQIEVAEPTPQLPHQQGESSSSVAVTSTTDKRRRSGVDVNPRPGAKRLRIILKRTPSPQPPTVATGVSSSSATTAEASKRRRSLSDPGPRQVPKRPRIVLKRTPSPLPPQQAPPEAPRQARRQTRSKAPDTVPSQAWLEDQISPKTVPNAPAPAEEPLASKKEKRSREPKPLPPDRPSTSNLTWAAVESLLPTSLFGQASWIHRRFWTVKEEIELRTSWSEADEASLKLSHAEVLAARFVSRLYGCQLQDLFRYGLKYIAPSPDRNGNPSDSAFWIRFLRLIPHPFFLGKIEILRYVLQQAIFYRTSNFDTEDQHLQPYVPPWSYREPGYITYLKEMRSKYPKDSSGWNTKTLEIIEASDFRCQTQVENKMWMQELCTVMGNWAEHFASQFPPQEADGLEMYLFVLTERDLVFVEFCLEQLDRAQRRMQEQRAQTWQETHRWNEYPGEIPYVEEHRGYHRSDIEFVLNTPAPPAKNVALEPITVDSAFLKYWTGLSEDEKFVTVEQKAAYLAERRLAVLSERREALIRQKIGAKGGRERRAVLDVPPFDPDPDFHLFEQRVSRRGGQMVIRGVYVTPDVSEWLRHWNRQKAEEEMRKNPGAAAVVLDSAVARVLGSWYEPADDQGWDSAASQVGPPLVLVAEDGGLGVAGQESAPPARPVVESAAIRVKIEQGSDDEGDAARLMAEARSSVVKQHAEYQRRNMMPPILSMGGGLWARRKGKGPARE